MLFIRSKHDIQYLLPFLICTVVFIVSNLLGALDKSNYAYWSGELFKQPYRILTSHFFHDSFHHLLANTFGIVIARYSLQRLGLKNNYLFLALVTCLVPTQTILFWANDVVLRQDSMSLAIGFSGILYGAYAFILLSSLLGKQHFLRMKINLQKSREIFPMMTTLIIIGLFYSLLPKVSLTGHICGLIAGSALFLF